MSLLTVFDGCRYELYRCVPFLVAKLRVDPQDLAEHLSSLVHVAPSVIIKIRERQSPQSMGYIKFFIVCVAMILLCGCNNADSIVYITDTGSCYHTEQCGCLLFTDTAVTLEDALKGGYTPCSRCRPPKANFELSAHSDSKLFAGIGVGAAAAYAGTYVIRKRGK